jgi:choline dehydrogenase-like flavoprotein
MGADPRTSVVDADLRVHGTANLYVAGSAGYVTGGAAHPTLLIVALAHRLADHLGVRLRLSEALPAAASRPSARAHNPV